MKSPPHIVINDVVEGQLREEARALRQRKSFSPELHAQIMDSLRAKGWAAEPEQSPNRFRPLWRIAFRGAIAAAIALGVWLGWNYNPGSTAPEKPVITAEKTIKPPPAPVPNVPAVTLGGEAFERGKYAYLDRDASRLWIFVADQIPNFPPQK